MGKLHHKSIIRQSIERLDGLNTIGQSRYCAKFAAREEVVAPQIIEFQVSARRGLLIIRRGKGLKHREVHLIQEARVVPIAKKAPLPEEKTRPSQFT